MSMIKTNTKPLSVNPKIMLLYGAPKVGKTTMLSKLDDCLIVDTESGSNMVSGTIARCSSREELFALLQELNTREDKFKYIALDTIDNIADWADSAVCEEEGVRAVQDLPFGKGFGLVRSKVMRTIETFSELTENLIIIGHRKVAYAVTDGSTLVIPESLDLTGKTKNLIMSKCDAIGYMYRGEEGDLRVSFNSNNAIEAGSRCEHLKGEDFPFEWNSIYKESTNEVAS